jgi:hypothetical protein
LKCNWIEKNKDKINCIIEIWYPFAFSGIILIIYLFLFRTIILDDKDNILNAVVSFSSILIGFIGTLIALLFSLENNLIAKFIFEDEHYKKLMKSYVVNSIQSGFILIVSSLALFFRNTISSLDFININIQPLNFTITLLYIIKLIWVFFLPYFGLSSYRIISIITKIAFNNLEPDNIEDDKNDDNFNVEVYEQVKRENEMVRTEKNS